MSHLGEETTIAARYTEKRRLKEKLMKGFARLVLSILGACAEDLRAKAFGRNDGKSSRIAQYHPAWCSARTGQRLHDVCRFLPRAHRQSGRPGRYRCEQER